MFSKKHNSTHPYIFLIILGIILFIIVPTAVSTAAPNAHQQLTEVWQKAGDIGMYQYRTDVVQTRRVQKSP